MGRVLVAAAVLAGGLGSQADARPRLGMAAGLARDYLVRELTRDPDYATAPVRPVASAVAALAKYKVAAANAFTADAPCSLIGGFAPFNVLCPFNSTVGFIWPTDVPAIAAGPATGAARWRIGPINYRNLVQYGAEALVSRAASFVARHTTYQRGRISLCEGSRSLWGCALRIAWQYVLVESTSKPDI